MRAAAAVGSRARGADMGVGGAAAGCRQGAARCCRGRRCALLADGLRALLLRSVGRRASAPLSPCARVGLASRRGPVVCSRGVLVSALALLMACSYRVLIIQKKC